MKNSKGLELSKRWWAHKDHQLSDTLKETDRKQLLKLIATYDPLNLLTVTDWPKILKVLDTIFILATNMSKQCKLPQKASKEALTKAAKKAQDLHSTVFGFKSFYDRLDKLKWTDIRNGKYFQLYCKANYQTDSFEFLGFIEANDGTATYEMLSRLGGVNLSGSQKTKLENLERDRRTQRMGTKEDWKPAVDSIEMMLRNSYNPDTRKVFITPLFKKKFQCDPR